MKNLFTSYLLWVVFALINSNPLAAQYSNATLNGPWLFYRDVSPIDPYNDKLLYFIFDGNGTITDLSGFGGPWTGSTYSVSAIGAISGTITNGSESFPFSGQLTSTTEGLGFVDGTNWRLHKIANPGALKDKIMGTISTTDCGSRNVTLNIDNNGLITSAIGLTGPVVGRVYADLGVYIGHMTNGEGDHWSELTINGFYNNNNLIGQLELDADSNTCINGTSNMARTDNLGINDNNENKNITIYPNPNNGKFNIDLKEVNSKIQIEIFNVWGQKLNTEFNLKQSTNKIDLSSYSKGIYLIKITDGENSYSEKIMIK